jgi:hypothetical protein
MTHKHAELIKQWADGAKVQYWSENGAYWLDTAMPQWHTDTRYRIKPEPKPDIIKYAQAASPQSGVNSIDTIRSEYKCWHNLKLVYDGSTGILKHAEAILTPDEIDRIRRGQQSN